MKKMMKRSWRASVVLAICMVLAALPAWSEDANVEDITKEVLTGPNELNPEKILGPGGVGINTNRDILMSFGATVRFVPTSESDWDFGLSEEVPGYFYTEPLKAYAGANLDIANSVQNVYKSSVALNDAITVGRQSASIIQAYDNFASAYFQANSVTQTNPALNAQVSALAAAMDQINQAAAAAPNDATKAAIIQAGVTSPNPLLGGANLLQVSSALAAGVAQQVNRDPSDTAQDLTGSIAYLTALKATADSFSPYYLANTFLRTHSNESGSVNDGYIRNETKIYFNAMAKDKKWSFYGALEYDHPIDTETVDNRGGRSDSSSNFGLERLNASIELAEGLRFHGGWDVWGIDIIESASMVYGDDNPGFWIKGDYNPFNFSVAWLKLEENDFQNSAAQHNSASDADRDLIAGYLDWKFMQDNKFRFFAAWDRIRNVPALDLTGAIANEAGLADYAGIYGNNGVVGSSAKTPDTDAFTIGTYYLGKWNILEFMAELAYKFGSADDTGLAGVDNGVSIIQYDDYDISAYAFAFDVGVELKDMVGWMSLKPHIGFMYTSGDDDAGDDELSGWTGITSAQRFSGMWGGENTIIGDTNLVLGSALYGYIPEFYGNGTPVFTGGIQNFTGNGNGRGDNPGLSLLSAGVTIRPKIYLIYRTNLNMFWWNEDFYVANMVNPIVLGANGLQKSRYTLVEAGYAGTEWDNEVTLALAKHMFVKGQFSFFFPGSAVEDVTRALSGGIETDETAVRLAMELIWNF